MPCASLYTQNLGVDMTLFQNRIVILPKNACTWGGLGTVGCTKSCYAWIKGDQVCNSGGAWAACWVLVRAVGVVGRGRRWAGS